MTEEQKKLLEMHSKLSARARQLLMLNGEAMLAAQNALREDIGRVLSSPPAVPSGRAA
jgi:hypothetical protein